MNVVFTHRVVSESEVVVESVKADLTLPLSDGGFLLLYERMAGGLLKVPRGYRVPWNSDNSPTEVKVAVPRKDSAKVCKKPETSVVLRPNQTAEVLGAFKGEGVVSLSCGYGKTVLAIYTIVTQNECPALIVVHTETLLFQWREEIKKHTNLTDEDIGTLRGPVIDIEGKAISIAVLNSVALKEYPPWVYAYFKVVVFDEVHKCGARELGKAVPRFVGRRLGLSATWRRQDGLHAVYLNHIGPVLFEDTRNDLVPLVCFYRTGIKATERAFRGMSAPIVKGMLVTTLSKNKERNRLILDQVDKALKVGRTLLVFGERREHLEYLYSQCKHPKKGLLLGNKGSKSKKKKEEARLEYLRVVKESDVIFAMARIADTGFSREDLDTIFVLFPFANPATLFQTVGRELRASDNKKQPLTVIFVDDVQSTKKRVEVSAWGGTTPVTEESDWTRRVAELESLVRSQNYKVRTIHGGT